MKTMGFGRFEQSFIFHMIRDFFLLLLVVALLEVGFRYFVFIYEFKITEQQNINVAAQQLADDVKSIMLNSGGPTAAQTVYPILNRNYQGLGLSIAVVPSALTTESIKQTFKFSPLGLQPQWPQGEYNQASINLHAEQFCLGCHVKAKVGDVLGTVSVRSYLEPKQNQWWRDVYFTLGALSVKIVLHTIVLFLLLKVRMEPLLSLRATTAALAKGVMNLSPRAQVNSADEFGEFAADLNHFLDRVKLIVHDLDKILGEVVSVGSRLGALNLHLEQQLDHLRDLTVDSNTNEVQRSLVTQVTAARESGAFEVLVGTLDKILANRHAEDAETASLRELIIKLKQSFEAVVSAVKDASLPPELARKQADQYQAFAQSLREMALLEASMQKVAESGQLVLKRLEDSSNADGKSMT
jgi:methyl-accepting chemotaxis protein